MKTKRILIGIPLFLLFLLLQSFFFVPRSGQKSTPNSHRNETYLDASIADAAILNPILNSDSASSGICDKVFDGLLDYDEELRFRGRLAKSWEISEEAILWVPERIISAESLRAQLETAVGQAPGKSPLKSVRSISIRAPETKRVAVPSPFAEEMKLTEIEVSYPAKLVFHLERVEQDFFKDLKTHLPDGYFSFFDFSEHLRSLTDPKARKHLSSFLSATEHHPILLFHLREGVLFHDGHPFTATDVKFTFDAIMNGRNLSPRNSDFEPVESVEIVDEKTVRVVYKRLYSPAINTWMVGILPEHLLSDAALEAEAQTQDLSLSSETFSMRASAFNRRPIGTGAFRFRQWKQDQFLHLERNEAYWDGPPNYRNYFSRIIPDLHLQEMELHAGALDGYGALPHQVERLKSDPRYQQFTGLSNSYDYIAYNMRRDIFQDVRVRRALSLAMDVPAIVKYLYYGHAEQTTGPFLKQTPYYDQTYPPLPYDLAKAAALLAEAGWVKNSAGKLISKETGKPLRFSLITNNGNDLRRGIMTIAQQSWAKLGVDIDTQTVEWTVFLQKYVNPGDFDALVLGWSMGFDPDLFQIWHSSQTDPQELNFVGYQNPEADELLVRIRQEYDLDRQIAYAKALHRRIAEDQPYTFLTQSRWMALLDRNIVRRVHEKTSGNVHDSKIIATKTGNYGFYFNQWIRRNNPLEFSPQ